jgi:hypothetical protein
MSEYKLTKEERLELHNLELRKKLLDIEYTHNLMLLRGEQEKMVSHVNERLGIRLQDARIDILSGNIEYNQEGDLPGLGSAGDLQEEGGPES